MRELTLRVAARDVEDVLDALLPGLPGGIHLRRQGEEAELKITAGAKELDPEELGRLAGSRLIELRSAEVPDDWRERRRARYQPLVVAGRILIRPEWAPPAEGPALLEIVLEQSSAFGTGVHPTTQACLTLLCTLEPDGSFADCGCGSGILAIAAAKLGWAPVIALDADAASAVITGRNAARNGVELDARQSDVTAQAVPPVDTVTANVPPEIQLGLAGATETAPSRVIVSGFKSAEADAVASAWEAVGLAVDRRLEVREWTSLLLRADCPGPGSRTA